MNNDNRSGIAFVELLIVSSVTVVLITMNIGWIHQSMIHAQTVSERTTHHRSAMRLAGELRTDVRYSDRISVVDQTLTVETIQGIKTQYTIGDNVIDRLTQYPSGTATMSKFAFAKNADIQWDQSAMPAEIGLLIKRSLPLRRSTGNVVGQRIAGAVDVDLRVGPRWRTVRRIGPDQRPDNPSFTDQPSEQSK